MKGLPEGWASTTLGEVATLASGATPKGVLTARPGPTPFYKVGDMNTSGGRFMADSRVTLSEEVVSALGLRIFPPGSVVFPKVGGALRTNKKRILSRPSTVDTNTMVATPTTAIDPRFLYHWLCSIRLSDYAHGSPVPSINRRRFAEAPLTLSPYPEQERIVAAIEEQFSRLDAGVAALERAHDNLRRMRLSVLQAACTGHLVGHTNADADPIVAQIDVDRRSVWEQHSMKRYKEPIEADTFPLSVPDHWRIASLESITDPVRVICYGILMPKQHIDDGIPYVRVKDMKGWTIDVPGLNRTSREIASQYARASLRSGDLLLAIRGSYGRVAIVPPELDGANITQDSARIASHPALNHRYLLYYLGGGVANRYYQRVARGVAVKGVNIGDLRRMPVPIPPPEEQLAIADEVERQFSLLNEAEAAVAMQLRHSSSLRSAILATAFSGELVPQDPDDEPASILLERIAAECAEPNSHKTNKARRTRQRKTIA